MSAFDNSGTDGSLATAEVGYETKEPQKEMKVMKTNKVMCGLLAVAVLVVGGISANAQYVSGQALKKALSESKVIPTSKAPVDVIRPQADVIGVVDKDIIVGSWIETINFNGPMPPLKSLSTYTSDGGLIVGDQGAVAEGSAFSPGHGSWTHVRGRTFDWTSLELIYSTADGTLIGYLKVKGRYTVNDAGNGYTGEFLAKVTDPDGNVLFSVDGNNVGTRIAVEPFL